VHNCFHHRKKYVQNLLDTRFKLGIVGTYVGSDVRFLAGWGAD